jgi:MFS family permease
MVLLALFGAVMGQGVIWYTSQFYAQSFLEKVCNLEFEQSRIIMLVAIALATPFFLFFGWLSDKIGRKWIMILGMLLGVILYRPIFGIFLNDTAVKEWRKDSKLASGKTTTKSDTTFTEGVGPKIINHYTSAFTFEGNHFTEKRTDTVVVEKGGWTVYPPLSALNEKGFSTNWDSLTLATIPGKPVYADVIVSNSTQWKFIFLVWLMIIFVTMVYGPIAAFLVEIFPTKIRYTSMSLPYHIGNGVFGGLVPFIGLLLTTTFPADPLVGLWYPIGVAALCVIIGTMYLTNKIDRNIND